jgi:hypothetical protein
MNIGIVVLPSSGKRKALRFANSVRSFLKGLGHKYYGATIEVINTQNIEKGKEKLQKQDGYIFVSEAFSDKVSEESIEFLESITEQLQGKAASIMCFGEDELEENTMNQLSLVLSKHFSTVFNQKVFFTAKDLAKWLPEIEDEEYIENWLDDFATLILAMKYMRNLKGRW